MIFRRWRPRQELRPSARSASGAALDIAWLGTAGHIVRTAGTTILIDPFLTRPGFARLLFGRLSTDAGALARLPEKVDAVLCGHSHFDHLLDAPEIARRTGALLVGSGSTCAFGRAAGLPETQLCEVPPEGRTLAVGDCEVRFVPSLHGRIFLGRVPFPGTVSAPRLPARMWHYRMGGAFGVLVRAPGATVYHNGSADLIDAELAGVRADVLLVGLAGRKATRDYLGRLVTALEPGLIVPTHHDAFFAPLTRGVHLLPGIDLDGFVSEVRRVAPRATLVTPDYFEPLAVPAGDARGAALVA